MLENDDGVSLFLAEYKKKKNQQIILRTNGKITTADHVKCLVLDMGFRLFFKDCIDGGNETF